MAISWSSGILNTLVAPNFTSFTVAEITDLRAEFPQAEHWLANHFLNSVTRGTYAPRIRQIILGFLRRAWHAFDSYHDARARTLEYCTTSSPHSPRLAVYYGAIGAWETYVLQLSMALGLYKWLTGGQGAFQKNDGSAEQRLYSIANHVKHVGSCVNSAQCTDRDTIPLWLANDGLRSFGTEASYEETANVLRELAGLADKMQDPVGFTSIAEQHLSANGAA